MSTPKFQRGDLVRHRASGEAAVVVDAVERCIRHSDHIMGAPLRSSTPCELGFAGTYELNLGLKEDVVTVEEYLLEAIEARGEEADRG